MGPVKRILTRLARVDMGAARSAFDALFPDAGIPAPPIGAPTPPVIVNEATAGEAAARTITYWMNRAQRVEQSGADHRGSEFPVLPPYDTAGSYVRPGVARDSRTGEPLAVTIKAGVLDRWNADGSVTMRAATQDSQRSEPRVYVDSYSLMDVGEVDMSVPVGNYGTPYAGGIPFIEQKNELSPQWKARGFSNDQGEFYRFYRGDPEIANAVDQRVNYLAGATWEFEAPEFDDSVYALARTTRDAVQRDADLLNAEFLLSKSVDTQQVISEIVRTAFICGFSAHEFWFDPEAPVGLRTRIEHRAPQSIQAEILTPRGDLGGITQTMVSGTVVTGGQRGFPIISARKLLWSTYRKVGANHEGVSGLRQPWWYNTFAIILLKASQLHWERFGPGFPIIRKKKEEAYSSRLMGTIQDNIGRFFYGPKAYLTLPADIELEMLQMRPESANLVAMLDWLEERKRRAVGADFFAIGTRSGSYALSDIVSQMMLKSLQGEATQYAAAFGNYANEYLRMFNGERSVLPVMRVRGIMRRSDGETIDVYNRFADLATKSRPDGTPVFTVSELDSLRGQLDVVQIADDEPAFLTEEGDGAEEGSAAAAVPGTPSTPAVQSGTETVVAAPAKPEPMAVGSLQASVDILKALADPDAPLAAGAAEGLLVAAGFDDATAAKMVASQVAANVASRQAQPAPAQTPAVQPVPDAAPSDV